jgi:hypothetical protein
LCLFPRESTRVREAARALRSALEDVRRAEGQPAVALLVNGDEIRLNGRQPDEVFGSTHAWLAERLRRSALTAVEFHPEASEETLTRFTLRLLENYTRKQQARFDQLGPERFVGIEPRELSFGGSFSPAGVAAGGGAGRGARLRADRQGARARARGRPLGGQKSLEDLLLASGHLFARVVDSASYTLPTPLPEGSRGGHAGDEEIADDGARAVRDPALDRAPHQRGAPGDEQARRARRRDPARAGPGRPAGGGGRLLPPPDRGRQRLPAHARRLPVSMSTRIVKICDLFEALTAVRPYKDRMSPARAYRVMMSMHKHFDPLLLRRFIEVHGIYPSGSRVRLSTGHVLEVSG